MPTYTATSQTMASPFAILAQQPPAGNQVASTARWAQATSGAMLYRPCRTVGGLLHINLPRCSMKWWGLMRVCHMQRGGALLVRASMFDSLSQRLGKAWDSVRKDGKLTPDNIKTPLREIRRALLEADVRSPLTPHAAQQGMQQLSPRVPAPWIAPGSMPDCLCEAGTPCRLRCPCGHASRCHGERHAAWPARAALLLPAKNCLLGHVRLRPSQTTFRSSCLVVACKTAACKPDLARAGEPANRAAVRGERGARRAGRGGAQGRAPGPAAGQGGQRPAHRAHGRAAGGPGRPQGRAPGGCCLFRQQEDLIDPKDGPQVGAACLGSRRTWSTPRMAPRWVLLV